MARPQKEGLDYFPLELRIIEDDKLIVPISKFGMTGLGIIIRIMMEIYRTSYYYPWSEREQYVFANRINADINSINEVINECIRWGFFDQKVYENHSVLTSNGFQKRYIEAAKRRKEITMIDDYVLADLQQLCNKHNIVVVVINADGNKVNVYKNELNDNADSTETPQRKEKGNRKKIESNNKTPRHKKEYAEDSAPYKMALYLHSKIMEHAEESGVGHLVKRANIQTWADDCRKLLEIDNVDKALIRDVIDWVTADSFWKTNILSASTLRDKFGSLAIKMNDEKKKGAQPPTQSSTGGKSRKPQIPISQPGTHTPLPSAEEQEEMLALARKLDEKLK